MRPFLKWAGGKYRLVNRIKERLPAGERLLEPFTGSCALSLNTDFPAYWLNDSNIDLITLYRVLQQEGTPFIDFCRQFFTVKNNTPECFYELRDRFNREIDPKAKSALFLYLNRHCFNGLTRYNADGEFNVPFGRYKKPYFPEKELRFFNEKLKEAVFTSLDFQEMMLSAGPGDIIYCDPPYVPLSRTSCFTSYNAGGFNEEDQIRLAKTAELLMDKRITTLISNHYSDFTLDLYQRAVIETFPVRRSISCDAKNRNKVQEILAVFSKA